MKKKVKDLAHGDIVQTEIGERTVSKVEKQPISTNAYDISFTNGDYSMSHGLDEIEVKTEK